MSLSSSNYKTPCPECGGIVEHWAFSSDCRDPNGSSGIECTRCEKVFTAEFWKKLDAAYAKARSYADTLFNLQGCTGVSIDKYGCDVTLYVANKMRKVFLETMLRENMDGVKLKIIVKTSWSF